MLFRMVLFFVSFFIASVAFAQEYFAVPLDELTPSEQRQENEREGEGEGEAETDTDTQQLSVQERKENVYNDLKYYFKEHKWIAIVINFEGYFDEDAQQWASYEENEIDKYGQEILTALTKSNYKEPEIFQNMPMMGLLISETALDLLYENKFVTEIYIDRKG